MMGAGAIVATVSKRMRMNGTGVSRNQEDVRNQEANHHQAANYLQKANLNQEDTRSQEADHHQETNRSRATEDASNAPIVRVRALVTGLVQGVGFRYFAYQAARRLGVTGWVRNRFDGDVEAEAQGPRDRVDAFVVQLRVGPSWGRVDSVTLSEAPVERGEVTFVVRR